VKPAKADPAKDAPAAPGLESLAAAAAAADAGTPLPGALDAPKPAAPIPAQSLTLARGLVDLVAKIAAVRWPVLVYPEEVRAELATAGAAVLDKYDINSLFFAKWKEEFALGALLAGLIYQGVELVKAEQNKAAPGDAAAADAPGENEKAGAPDTIQ